MGYVRNNAIIFSTFAREYAERAHTKAIEIFDPILVTDIHGSIVNDHYSFAILPDGSKEGWEESDEYDQKRQDFTFYLREKSREQEPEETNIFGDWVDVWFDEEGGAGIEEKPSSQREPDKRL